MSLDIPIRISTDGAAETLKGVEDGLHKTEDRGIAAGKAMLGLAGNFKSLGEALKQEQAALTRTAELHDKMTAAAPPLAQGMERFGKALAATQPHAVGSAQALQREIDVLEKLHRPAREYMNDLQALDALLEKDAISTKVYAEQVALLNKQQQAASQQGGQGGGGGVIGKIAEASEATKILEQRLKEVGKGVAFGLLAQQFDHLKGVIGDTSSAAISAGAQGAAMGATFAGPVGAAIGGLIGVTKGLVTGFLDEANAAEAAKKKIEEEGRAYWEQVKAAERAKQVTAELSDVQRQIAEDERKAGEAAQTHNDITNASADAFRHAADQAMAYQDQLSGIDSKIRDLLQLRGQLAKIFTFDWNAGQTDEESKAILASRGERDAKIAEYAATKSYGQALLEVMHRENERKDRLQDLEGMMGDVNIPQEIQNKLLKEYNSLVITSTASTKAFTAARADDADTAAKALERARYTTDFDSLLNNPLYYGPASEKERQQSISNVLGGIGDAFGSVGGAAGNALDNTLKTVSESSDDVLQKAREDAEHYKEAWASAGGEAAGSLARSMIEGKESVSQTIEEIMRKLAMVAAQQAAMRIGGAGSPYGAFAAALFGQIAGGRDGFDYVANSNALQLPGFADGGDGIIRGGGSQDSHLLMARISAGESFHVRTSQQRLDEEAQWDSLRRAAGRGGPAAGRVLVIAPNSPRDVTAAFDTNDGERQVVRINRKYAKHRVG